MTPLQKCDEQMGLAWNGDGDSAKAYLYMRWFLDWQQEKEILQGAANTI